MERKRAIVIGASSGIGLAVARLLLKDRWQVGVAARREEPLKNLKSEFPDRVEWVVIDVTAKEAPSQLSMLIERLGDIDLLFYASGIGQQNVTLASDIEATTVQTNAVGFTQIVGEAFRYFAKQGEGHIAVVSSIAGIRGLGPSPSYSATKAFQNVYIEALEQQAYTRNFNISFTDIRPGFVDTPLLGGNHYPHTLTVDKAAKSILKAVYRKKHIVYIDNFWHIVVLLMRCIPKFIWRRLCLAHFDT